MLHSSLPNCQDIWIEVFMWMKSELP